jgi:glycerophosphoryl diester phosphodiesterase
VEAPVPFLNNTGPHQDSGQPQAWPLAFAHRGFSITGCENSLAAFRGAVELGFAYVETDVRTTRDGVLMAFHDDTLDRVTDGLGPINSLTAAELKRVRIGGVEPIPTMDELLSEWPDLKINIDVKDLAGADLLAQLIERHRAHDRVLVASFSDRRRLRVLRRLTRPAASSAGVLAIALLKLLGPLGLSRFVVARLGPIHCVQVPARTRFLKVVTARFVRRCHRAGLQVHVWTVNDAPAMRELLDMGVDGIMTDRADILAEVMQERGCWLPRR